MFDEWRDKRDERQAMLARSGPFLVMPALLTMAGLAVANFAAGLLGAGTSQGTEAVSAARITASSSALKRDRLKIFNERPHRGGRIGLYAEDASADFDGLRVSRCACATASSALLHS